MGTKEAARKPNIEDLLRKFGALIPPLDGIRHKGSYGRIAIVGGSFEYTGAPYYAAISALRGGADLATVVCHPEAAGPIKAYSPELIVYPLLNLNRITEMLEPLKRAHAIVIGPGLGRSRDAIKIMQKIVACATEEKIPVVVDADGLWILAHDTTIIKDTTRLIVTPNAVEYRRLLHSVDKSAAMTHGAVCAALGAKVVMVAKGHHDTIVTADTSNAPIYLEDIGSPRRCGGQGDVLSGLCGVFAAWLSMREKELSKNEDWRLVGVAACYVTRACAQAAFETTKRSTLTTDIIEQIGEQFEKIYPAASDGRSA